MLNRVGIEGFGQSVLKFMRKFVIEIFTLMERRPNLGKKHLN